jgi:intracellular sulfur oxidation DsrE/DsrF family protein
VAKKKGGKIILEKWLFQVMDSASWDHILVMKEGYVGKVDLKVVALGSAIVPLFAAGTLRAKIEDLIKKGVKVEICTVSMKLAGLSDAVPPVNAILKPGLLALSDSQKEGYMYFAVA